MFESCSESFQTATEFSNCNGMEDLFNFIESTAIWEIITGNNEIVHREVLCLFKEINAFIQNNL